MLRRLLSYMHQYRKFAAAAVVCVVAETIFELVIPLLMADILDVGAASGDREYIFARGGTMIFCAALALLCGIGSSRFSAVCGQGLGAELRKEEYRKMQKYSFSNMDHFRTSSLVTRLTSDVTNIQNAVSSGIRPLCRSPIMLVLALGASFYINAKLAAVFFVAAPLLGVLLFLIIRRVRPVYGRMQRAIDLVNRMIQENLTAIRVVKAYVKGDYEIAKFAGANEDLQKVSERAFRTAVLNMPAMQFVMYGTILSILWFGGGMIRIGDMQVGELTGFLSYVLQVLNSLMMLSNVFLMLTRSLASGERILEVIDEPVELSDDQAGDARVQRGEITFEHVWFKYQESAREYVLSDICFHISPGQTIGIIGQTGSAKTTLIQLIPRLYQATKGKVLVDGIPVENYTMRHLRDAIAVVLQKNTLFSGTVKENLKWGKEDATDEEIEEVCRIACADEFIGRLENGYDTQLGQGGVNVSGGQKQRLCIARALLKRPKVLILDDSTSAVDTATEAKLRAGLKTHFKDMTKIMIAQRITSVMDADQILVLENGKLHGIGTHEQLLQSDEIYQDIYRSQQMQYQEGGI